MALLCFVGIAARAADLEILQQWSGVIHDDGLKARSPASHAIVDKAAWEKLWNEWRGAQAIPPVDFQKELVLVALVDGPNQGGVGKLTIDAQGNVQILAFSTRMAGPGFGYILLRVNKAGIKSVEGQPLPAGADGSATSRNSEG
jgi:hypothetical protein